MMKHFNNSRCLRFLALLGMTMITIGLSAQGPGKFNQNLNRQRYYGLISDSMMGLPKDTFRTNVNTVDYKNYRWLATDRYKNRLYLWDTTTYKYRHIGYDSIYVRTSTDSVFGRFYGSEVFLFRKDAGAGVYVDSVYIRNDTLFYKKNAAEFTVRKITDVESVQDAVGAMINASLQYVDGTPLLSINDRDFGDFTFSSNGLVGTIDPTAVTYDKIQNVSATNRVLGRMYSTGTVEELSGADLINMIDLFTSTTKGIVPASGGGTTNFLRADGTWAAAGGGTNNTNTGSGYRLLKPAGQEIKTLFGGYGIVWDSTSNSNGITGAADSSTVSTKAYALSLYDILNANKLNKSDTTGKWIWNQYAQWQDAQAWFKDLKLRTLLIGSEDSAYFPWMPDNLTGTWATLKGKLFQLQDIDTVTAANDDWPYAVNVNALVSRITRLVPDRYSGYRHNFNASQNYEASMNRTQGVYSLGGDTGGGIYGRVHVTDKAGQNTGNKLINGGSVYFDGVPVIVAMLEVSPKSEAVGTSTRRLGGYWTGINSYVNIANGDSIDHHVSYQIGRYYGANTRFKSSTGFYNNIDQNATVIPLNWNMYAPDALSHSYNLFGGRVGIGGFGFGTHDAPTYHSSAALQINSNDRGFITARMTAAQRSAISSPDTALFVWDSDSSRYMGYVPGIGFKGIAWTGEAGGGSTPTLQQVVNAGNSYINSGSGDGINVDNQSSGYGAYYNNSSTGNAIFIANNGSGAGFKSNVNSTGAGIQLVSSAGGGFTSANLLEGKRGSALRFKLDSLGLAKYGANYGSLYDARTLVDKNYVDSAITAGGGGGHTIRNEGSNLTSRTGLNFIGSAVNAADDAGGDETEITFDAEVNGIADLASNGIVAKTGAGTFAGRTITGTTNQVTVTNGDGVSGNPTLAFPLPGVKIGQTNKDFEVAISGASAVGTEVKGFEGQVADLSVWKDYYDSTQFSIKADGAVEMRPTFQDWYQLYGDPSGNTQSYFFMSSSGSGASFTRPATGIADGWLSGWKLSTGTTTTGFAYSCFGSGSGYAPITFTSSKRFNAGTKVRLEDLSNGTETYEYFFGFGDDANGTANIVDGAYFRYKHSDSSGQWIACTKSNSTLTEDALGVTVAADTDYELEVSVYNGQAKFYVNKVLYATISTNIPSGTTRITSVVNVMHKLAGTTNRDAYVEWIGLGKRNN